MIPERMQKHYGTRKPKERLLSILDLHGRLDQQALLDKYNKTWADGITMYQLRSLLRDKSFEQVGSVPFKTFTGRSKVSPIWRIAA